MSRPISASAFGSLPAQASSSLAASTSINGGGGSQQQPQPSNAGPKPLSALPLHLRRSSSSGGPKQLAGGAAASGGGPKGTPAQTTPKLALPARTSKSAKKLVFLPEDVQSQPLPAAAARAAALAAQSGTTAPAYQHRPRPHGMSSGSGGGGGEEGGRSSAELMNKEERERSGLGRLTAYATAESYRLRTLAAFLKREHNAEVRQFDEALYAVYTLPLLPGYNPAVNVRSSLAVTSPGGGSIIHAMEHAEERGYEGSYFPLEETEGASGENGGQSSQQQQQQEGQEGDRAGMHGGERERPKLDMESNSIPDLPVDLDPPSSSSASAVPLPLSATAAALEEESASTAAAASLSLSSSPEASLATSPLLHSPGHSAASFPSDPPPPPAHPLPPLSAASKAPKLAEALFFDYGVSVFFGLTEHEERQVLEDCEGADGCWVGSLGEPGDAPEERGWEMEECHFEYDPTVAYPRIFNDMFTFKSPSHLLKLSLSHALAQSTKLSVYETAVQSTTASASYIPKELAMTGTLKLDRKDAVKLTGRLFKLRVEVNLVSNVLDTPELFWSEASLKPLYDAIREYLEIDGRVAVLNERLGVVGDLLDMIHQHVDEAGMRTVTWIVIWLIVVACCVEAGEILARLVVHATKVNDAPSASLLLGSSGVLGQTTLGRFLRR